MSRLLVALGMVSVVGLIRAQTCPSINLLQGSTVNVFQTNSFAAGLQRRPDGSYTRYRYQVKSPYNKIDSTPNVESGFLNCSAAGARSFRTPAGWQYLTDQIGSTSRSWVYAYLKGNTVPAIVSTNSDERTVLVGLANPDGSLNSYKTYAVRANADSLLVGDFNNDGNKDIVVVSSTTTESDPGTILLLPGNGDGTFQPAVSYPAHNGTNHALAFDFNHDGYLDLAVVNANSNDVSILINNANGTFRAAVNYSAGINFPAGIALGDFNGDGRPDVVVGGRGAVAILAGNGDGTFQAGVVSSTPLPNGYIGTMAVGDFNNDGKSDLVITDGFGSGSAPHVALMLGNGHGGFSGDHEYAVSFGVFSMFATDFDGDGNVDVVLAAGHPDVLGPDFYVDFVTVLFGRGDGTLIAPQAFLAPAGLMALADFTGDGKPDLAVGYQFNSGVHLYAGRGDGTFQPSTNISINDQFGNPVRPQGIVAGDFNGDNNQDLAFSDDGNNLYVLIGNGNGSFKTPVTYTLPGKAQVLATGRFSSGGKLDLVMGVAIKGADGRVMVLPGNGDGTFRAAQSVPGAGSNPVSIAVGDYNRDGIPDVALVNGGTFGNDGDQGGLVIFPGAGNGTFGAPRNYAVGINPSAVAAGDLNGDGALDLAVTTNGPNFSNNVGILLNGGAGIFGQAALLPTDFGPDTVAIADMDGDGKLDLVIGHCCGEVDTTFLTGNGNGTFQPETHFAPAASPNLVLAVDVNGDGKPDLISGSADSFEVFPNLSTGAFQIPTVTPPVPAAGTGSTQNFTFKFSDPAGAQSFSVLNVLINNSLDGRHACYLAYVVATSTLVLVDDAGDAGGPYAGAVAAGNPGTVIQNSQCGVSLTSANVNGASLTLQLAITFKPAFGGNKIQFVAGRDAGGNNTGWIAGGVWSVPPSPSGQIVVTGASPVPLAAPAGTPQTVTFTLTDTKGASDLGVVNVLINQNFIDGRSACYLAYVAATNTLFLVDDAGDAGGPFAGGMVLNGSAQTIQNGQCSISGVGSSAAAPGSNALGLTLNLTFKPAFVGNHAIWVSGRDRADGNNTDWQAVGTAVVQ